MRIGIHNEPFGGGMGGSEVCVAVLAEALSKDHTVEVLHHREAMNPENLGRFAGVDLSRVVFKRLPFTSSVAARGVIARLNRYLVQRREAGEVSRPYDVFITFTHGAPPVCMARAGVVVVLFPNYDPEGKSDRQHLHPLFRGRMGQALWVGWNRWKLRSALGSYRETVSISEFTRRWTLRIWGVESRVIFPPVQTQVVVGEKQNGILSVGRFALQGHGKKQLEMVRGFAAIDPQSRVGWVYDCVGGCGDSPEESEFLAKVRTEGLRCDADVRANLPLDELKALYQRSKIFWHAAGMDVDEEREPRLTEHFGITTVEAMAHGCVPVVINKGGQKEIVEHGVSGFLWDTVEELVEYTRRLMNDKGLWQRMSAAARERSLHFSRQAFNGRFESLLAPYLRPAAWESGELTADREEKHTPAT